MAKEIFLVTCLILVVSSFVESKKRRCLQSWATGCYTTGCCQKRGCCPGYNWQQQTPTVLKCQVIDISGVESRVWYKDGNGDWQYYKFVEKCVIDEKATKEAEEARKEAEEARMEELKARREEELKAREAKKAAAWEKMKAAKEARKAARAEELAKTSAKKPTKFASQGQ